VIKALIFDYFGVIRLTGLRSAFISLGGDLSRDEAFVTDVTTAANYGFIHDADEQLAAHLGVDVATWQQAVAGSNGNDPVLLAYIEATRTQGTYKTALLSNAGSQALQDYFVPGEIDRYFDAALVSGDTGFVKPEAAFYRMMADKLGVEPDECVMIDDREEFCRGAEYIGMRSIHYRNYQQFRQDLDELTASQSAE
jgi:epoxide hydrolase-like predicted phosphatase